MATQDDVRTIASSLPGTVEGEERFAFSVMIKGKPKGFLWTWAERIHPKKPKVINEGVIAIVVPNLQAKEMILTSNPAIYFTEDHYNGFSAVLVRLEAISVEELRPLIEEAWKCKAPTSVVKSVMGDV
jgi:hypothetical protein